MKTCPSCNRTYADETFSFCLEDGSLLSASSDPEATLVMETYQPSPKSETPSKKSVGKPLKPEPHTLRIAESVIAIYISEQYPHCKNATDLYSCTRGLWRLKKERAENAQYAFAVYGGEIREVYEIDKWLPATKTFSDFWLKRLKSQGRIISPDEHAGRYEFIGRVAPAAVRKKYVGQLLPTRSYGNPILYFNC